MTDFNLTKLGSTTEQRMSSLEIAELTGKEHAHIMRDIRNIVSKLDERGQSNFGLSSYKSGQNKELPCYLLTQDGCLCLVAGYDANIRMKIIQRWHQLELERAQAKPIVTLPTRKELAQLVVQQEEELERLALENKAQEETIYEQSKTIRTLDEEIDALTPTSKLTFSEVAKLINRSGISGIGRNKLLDFAREKGYLMKYHNEPYQSALDKFEFKTVKGYDGRKFKQPIVKRSFLKQFVREAIEYVTNENLLKVESLF